MSKYALGDDPEYRAALNAYSIERYNESVELFLAYAHKRIKKRMSVSIRSFQFWEFWNNLGNSFAMLKEFKKAETCYLNAILCFKESKLTIGTGIVLYNYASMLFFEKKQANDFFKAYILFLLANKCGFKNSVSNRISEYILSNSNIVKQTSQYFFNSNLYKILKKVPYMRDFIRMSSIED